MAPYQILYKSIEKFAIQRAQKFQLFHTSVTLTEGQGLSHWFQTKQFSCVYLHTKFNKRSWPVNVQIQANKNLLVLFWGDKVTKVRILSLE